ncbi:class II fructose-bisphosphate aldolase [Adhaeribacter swui]|uniref:Class II fructose-bisphosphate aldolase n=1 Tax=Adhaeribacter swui TaxID=2086471 RepID=A0A7G7G8N2_9BACT|nr:class II fructose-bisphosphate aldolase [Adhaeribacter swui]QNF33516.1 class II fructose-bisphosphate aldolase [Adhaeribacter swui]
MTLKQKMQVLTDQKKGLLATNFYNLETLHGVLRAAASLQQPLILQLTRSSIEYMGLQTAVNMGRSALEAFGVEGWLHLDHGDSLELVRKCLDAGFDSVMFDGSELPIKDNIKLTAEAVKIAGEYGATVEGELGYVAKLGQSHVQQMFTSPEEASLFVEETGVDALAVAIGSAHGFYKEVPKLQLPLLSEIHAKTDAILVLHGSSGIPEDQVQAAISRGICKVNLATEIKNMFMKSLQALLRDTDEIDLRKVFPKATEKVTELVMEKLISVQNLKEYV